MYSKGIYRRTSKPSSTEIRNYMKEEIKDHVDWTCLEVNSTALAEDAAEHFSLYGNNYSIDDSIYDMATEVAMEWEKKYEREIERESDTDDGEDSDGAAFSLDTELGEDDYEE